MAPAYPSPLPHPRSPAIKWRLVVDVGGRPAAENMALDDTLLDVAARTGAAFLRLYRWAPPALSFGRHETALGRYDRAAIERLGLDVVRRPTGGRAVWHEHEVTYAVAAPVALFGSLRDAYRTIHARLAAALRSLGAGAELAPDERPTEGLASGACFAAALGGEVTVGGRKIVGSAQVGRGAAFLQHGSILLDGSQNVIARVSRYPAPPLRATTLAAVLGRSVSFDEVASAIAAAWEPATTSTIPHHPPPSPTVFADPAWTWRR